ncbi:helix-turn-helix domain-containing protein, partial [Eubacterium limosum]|uniref:helix-turn-helix domain-containing protein n=1 Tax=Eubacterium limosum TaxID=1736 RepID=UPI001D094FDA
MSHYKHPTPSEREKIYLLYAQNYSLSFIANSIGRNKSTVSRELTRNSNKDRYSPSAAQAAY